MPSLLFEEVFFMPSWFAHPTSTLNTSIMKLRTAGKTKAGAAELYILWLEYSR